jgi:hypothetical protein
VAQNVNPTFVKTPNWGAVQITTGTGSSGVVTIYNGGVNGSKINSFIGISIATTNPYDVQWGVSSAAGGSLYIYGTVSIAAAAGSTDTIAAVNMLSNTNLPSDSDGNPFLFLPSSSYSIQAKTPALSSAWTTGAAINLIVPSVGDF